MRERGKQNHSCYGKEPYLYQDQHSSNTFLSFFADRSAGRQHQKTFPALEAEGNTLLHARHYHAISLCSRSSMHLHAYAEHISSILFLQPNAPYRSSCFLLHKPFKRPDAEEKESAPRSNRKDRVAFRLISQRLYYILTPTASHFYNRSVFALKQCSQS